MDVWLNLIGVELINLEKKKIKEYLNSLYFDKGLI